ncbi:AAA family ATPase [Acidipropionibacterium timonense]|uniref:AAA family ATPase n=1 Tax=Acidipropionibacterium timonense TaxID=2161818 RepID=UPI001031AF8A|nr:AAA family ATPase [Acidipropionibacterium timonense]
MEYLPRTVDHELDELLPEVSAIALDGPKGVGKTATAQRRATAEWRLDDPAQREVARADFALTSAPMGTLLIDEWQHVPQVWDAVRRQVDAGAPSARFLLTGSATPVDAAGTHSGAGRILSLRMRPLALHERGILTPTVSLSKLLAGTQGDVGGSCSFTVADYAEAITASGFPGIHTASARVRRGASLSVVSLPAGPSSALT